MINVRKITKEVSCKVFITAFEIVKKKNIDLKLVLKDIPYNLDYLLNKHERIEWEVLCKLIDNLRPLLTISDFEEMGALDIKKGFNVESVFSGFLFFSLNKVSKIIGEKIVRSGEHNVSCIKGKVESAYNDRIQVKYYIDENHEFIPEFVYVMRGSFLELGKLFGYRDYKIKTIWISRGAIFDISWKKEGIFSGVKKWFIWIFNIHKTFLELTDSHEQLLNQYNKLEESKTLLQKQTTQLKTAHEITKSIRQSLNINETLNTITKALVNEANFSSAHIKLFKDIEGKDFKIEVFSGIIERNINSLNKSIFIDNEKIGELIIYPQMGTDISESGELLNYLLPIINISIHDSLVLRTITDYKNNL
jgi:hypothetical protein